MAVPSMRLKIITESSRRITKAPYRFTRATLAAILVASAAPASAGARADHVRGIILGTTMTSLDVGTPSRKDIHLEMPLEPYVVIAEPGSASAIAPGTFVSVLTDAKNGGVRCIVIVPDTAHVFSAGRFSWDAPGPPSMLTSGRVSALDAQGAAPGFTLSYRGKTSRFTFGAKTPVVALRSGTRAALLSPHGVFVFATPPTTELTDTLRSVIVADGTLALPF